MSRIVRHRDDDTVILFNHPALESYQSCDDRIVCLSERSMEIIITCLNSVEQIRTRVFSEYLGHQEYMTATDDEFEDFQFWISDIRSQLGGYMACNENLGRIATALEAQLQAQDEQTVNLMDVFEALGIDPTESEADILEALDYLINFPGFSGLPSLKLPLGDWISSYFESRYKSAHLQLLRDISISQRGQTVAQGGLDFASMYDTLGETADSLLVKAGYAGKAYWIWRWVDNDQLPGWLGWVSTISGLVLGSIRGAGYDIVEAVENLLGIQTAIETQTLTAIVNCNSCTTSEINEHLDPPGAPTYVTVPTDSSWPDIGEPPTSDDTTWNNPPGEVDYKCQGSRYVVDWLAAFYGHSDWNLSEDDNLITLADKFAAILADIPPIGPFLNGLSSIIGLTLAYLSGGSTDIFIQVNEKIIARLDDLYCALYNASTPAEARQEFKDIMIEEGINSLALSGLDVFLTMNNIMAVPFFEPAELASAIALKSDDCPCDELEGVNYTVSDGVETSDPEGEANPIHVTYDGAPYACGGDGWDVAIAFHAPVTIDSVEIFGGSGVCSGYNLYYYFADEAQSTLILATNGRPQDDGPVTGVRAFVSVTSGDPTPYVYIGYTPE